MKFCEECEIVYTGSKCPSCEKDNTIQNQQSTIRSLLKLRTSISNDRILTLDEVSKVLHRERKTLYFWNSTLPEDERIPWRKDGKENVIRLSRLKQWAEINDRVLDLTQINLVSAERGIYSGANIPAEITA